jgi:hypothetical protein
MVDIAAVPHGLEDAVGKPENQNVLNGLFSQVMIDTVDLIVADYGEKRRIQGARRFEIVAERLLDDDAAPMTVRFIEQAAGRQMLYDRQKELGRGGEVKQTVAAQALRPVHFFENGVQPLPSGCGLEIRRDVAQPGGQPADGLEVATAAARLPEVVCHCFADSLLAEIRKGKTGQGEMFGEQTVRREIVDCGHEKPLRQVARNSEDHHRARSCALRAMSPDLADDRVFDSRSHICFARMPRSGSGVGRK